MVGADSRPGPSFVLPAQLILEQIRDAVVAIDPEGCVTYWGNGAVALYRVPRSEALGRPLTQLYEYRWSAPDEERAAHAALHHQGHWRGRNVHVLRSGEELHVDSTVTALRDGEGKPVGMLAVIRDVTELTHTAAELRRREAEFQLLADNTPDILSRVDRQLRHVFVNAAIVEATGLQPGDFIGKTNRELGMPAELCDAWEGKLRAAFEGTTQHATFRFPSPEGERCFDSVLIPERGADGTVEQVLGVARDVTAHIETTAELERLAKEIAESRARSDYAVALSGIGFWYSDLPFDELAWDVRVKSHFFLPPDARVTIDTFYERVVPEDRARVRAAVDAAIRDRTTYDIVYRTHDPASGEIGANSANSAITWIRAMGGTSYAPDGTPMRFDGVTVDVSAQKRGEERITSTAAQLEEAGRVKDEFLAMLGHELRNPLAPIATAVHLLKLRTKDSVPHELRVIERQSQHITRMVDDLLDVSRIARGKVVLDKDTTDVADLVAAAIETASPLIEQNRHVLVLEVPKHALVVDVDRTRMTQVLSNLLANAAKYTPAGGRIAVTASREGGDVAIAIEDTGMGISSELLPIVFDLFVQSRQTLNRAEGGLGLGLSIVKNLVALHGGNVSAHSDGLGRGSRFTVRLPAVEAPAASVEGPSRPLAVATAEHHHRVLVVDDNEDGADMLGEVLRGLGYRIAVANDGPEALRIATEFVPHVALLDIGLPVMDGYELGSILREQSLGMKLVAITGYGQESDLQRSRDAGFQAHLTKPVDLGKLASLLTTLTAYEADVASQVD